LVVTQNHKAKHQHYLLRVKIEHLIEYSYREMELPGISNKSFKTASQNQHQALAKTFTFYIFIVACC
jgi:hypothetical protein